MAVIGIEHFNNALSKVFLLYSLYIVSFIKGFQVKLYNRLCIPDTQCVYNIVAIADDGQIIRYSINGLIIRLDKTVFVGLFIPYNTDIAAKLDLLLILSTFDLKRIAILSPVIRHFHLIAIFDLLLEKTVFITDTASVRRIAQCGQRI